MSNTSIEMPTEKQMRELGKALGWQEMEFRYVNITTRPELKDTNSLTGTSTFSYAILECYAELKCRDDDKNIAITINPDGIRVYKDGETILDNRVQIWENGKSIPLGFTEKYQPVVNFLRSISKTKTSNTTP